MKNKTQKQAETTQSGMSAAIEILKEYRDELSEKNSEQHIRELKASIENNRDYCSIQKDRNHIARAKESALNVAIRKLENLE